MILVFKTNLRHNDQKKIVKLLSSLDQIKEISFDFEDCDNILRIVSNKDVSSAIRNMLFINGFYSRELQ
ncbi:hypothetical protein [Lacinutrix undariae]